MVIRCSSFLLQNVLQIARSNILAWSKITLPSLFNCPYPLPQCQRSNHSLLVAPIWLWPFRYPAIMTCSVSVSAVASHQALPRCSHSLGLYNQRVGHAAKIHLPFQINNCIYTNLYDTMLTAKMLSFQFWLTMIPIPFLLLFSLHNRLYPSPISLGFHPFHLVSCTQSISIILLSNISASLSWFPHSKTIFAIWSLLASLATSVTYDVLAPVASLQRSGDCATNHKIQ